VRELTSKLGVVGYESGDVDGYVQSNKEEGKVTKMASAQKQILDVISGS